MRGGAGGDEAESRGRRPRARGAAAASPARWMSPPRPGFSPPPRAAASAPRWPPRRRPCGRWLRARPEDRGGAPAPPRTETGTARWRSLARPGRVRRMRGRDDACPPPRRGPARTGAGRPAGVAAAPTPDPRAPRRRTRAAPLRALFRPLQVLAFPWIDAHALTLADEIGHLYGDAVRELGGIRACRLPRGVDHRCRPARLELGLPRKARREGARL